ncbi:MAG: glycosyltransferase family 9 protein [Vicinamibacterales bacterium]
MTRSAIAELRRIVPGAAIDLVVGSWNAGLARLLPGLDRVETLDMSWLARGAARRQNGRRAAARLARQVITWRKRRYDLAINFEPDIRSNFLMAMSGARRLAGFGTAGGGPLLTDVVPYDRTSHVSTNSIRLVRQATTGCAGAFQKERAASQDNGATGDRLVPPEHARRRARALIDAEFALARIQPAAAGPLVGLHAGGARGIKRWPPDRFAAVAARIARVWRATTVLVGDDEDAGINESLRGTLSPGVPVVDLTSKADIVTLAAILERLSLLLAVDSGPMHLADAVGTPLVAVFGPSDPKRWGPSGPLSRAVQASLPCSPCNRIRRPPQRCSPGVPDCMLSIQEATVYEAAASLLEIGRISTEGVGGTVLAPAEADRVEGTRP